MHISTFFSKDLPVFYVLYKTVVELHLFGKTKQNTYNHTMSSVKTFFWKISVCDIFEGQSLSEVAVWLLWNIPKWNIASPFWSKNNTSLSPSPSLFFIGCFLCQHVFCFQGIKAHGSATLSSRRQLSECLCSDIRWLDVIVSCSGLPYCDLVDGTTGGLIAKAWLINVAPEMDYMLISNLFTSQLI